MSMATWVGSSDVSRPPLMPTTWTPPERSRSAPYLLPPPSPAFTFPFRHPVIGIAPVSRLLSARRLAGKQKDLGSIRFGSPFYSRCASWTLFMVNSCPAPLSSSRDRHCHKLQALVYDILPSTTAVFSYAIGSRKQSANEQSFVGAQTVVSLLQTTQIKQGVSFIAANKVYTSTNKTTIV